MLRECYEQAQEALDQAVYQLYDLSEQEIIVVEDTLRYGIDVLLHRNKKKKGQHAVPWMLSHSLMMPPYVHMPRACASN